MLARVAMVVVLIQAWSVFGQELRGKEASEVLAAASAKIKANCDAIKSWKGKIEAKHDKSHISATFAIATNGDVLVHIDEMSGHKMTSNGVTRVVERGEANPYQMEFFVHGDVVDRVTFPLSPIPAGSNSPNRITKQVSKEKFQDNIRSTFVNPQLLFIDNGEARIDEFLERTSQSALREDSTVVVSKPMGGDGIWTLKVQYKGSDPTATRLLAMWKLDEAKGFLPIFRSESFGANKVSERAIDYQLVGTVLLPQLVVWTQDKRLVQFKVTTESLNEGPETIEVKHRENDLLTDVDGNYFKFSSGEFRPFDPKTRRIKE